MSRAACANACARLRRRCDHGLSQRRVDGRLRRRRQRSRHQLPTRNIAPRRVVFEDMTTVLAMLELDGPTDALLAAAQRLEHLLDTPEGLLALSQRTRTVTRKVFDDEDLP